MFPRTSTTIANKTYFDDEVGFALYSARRPVRLRWADGSEVFQRLIVIEHCSAVSPYAECSGPAHSACKPYNLSCFAEEVGSLTNLRVTSISRSVCAFHLFQKSTKENYFISAVCALLSCPSSECPKFFDEICKKSSIPMPQLGAIRRAIQVHASHCMVLNRFLMLSGKSPIRYAAIKGEQIFKGTQFSDMLSSAMYSVDHVGEAYELARDACSEPVHDQMVIAGDSAAARLAHASGAKFMQFFEDCVFIDMLSSALYSADNVEEAYELARDASSELIPFVEPVHDRIVIAGDSAAVGLAHASGARCMELRADQSPITTFAEFRFSCRCAAVIICFGLESIICEDEVTRTFEFILECMRHLISCGATPYYLPPPYAHEKGCNNRRNLLIQKFQNFAKLNGDVLNLLLDQDLLDVGNRKGNADKEFVDEMGMLTGNGLREVINMLRCRYKLPIWCTLPQTTTSTLSIKKSGSAADISNREGGKQAQKSQKLTAGRKNSDPTIEPNALSVAYKEPINPELESKSIMLAGLVEEYVKKLMEVDKTYLSRLLSLRGTSRTEQPNADDNDKGAFLSGLSVSELQSIVDAIDVQHKKKIFYMCGIHLQSFFQCREMLGLLPRALFSKCADNTTPNPATAKFRGNATSNYNDANRTYDNRKGTTGYQKGANRSNDNEKGTAGNQSGATNLPSTCTVNLSFDLPAFKLFK